MNNSNSLGMRHIYTYMCILYKKYIFILYKNIYILYKYLYENRLYYKK